MLKKLGYSLLALSLISISACDNTNLNIGEVGEIDPSINISSNDLSITQDRNFLTFFSNTYDGDPSQAQGFEDNPDKRFIRFVNETKKTLDICIYQIDSSDITDAIINAYKRGVKVRMVIDSDTNNTEAMKRIREAGIPVVDDNGRGAYMHNKFIISDNSWVWTGSYNLTNNASWKHNDNVIKINSRYMSENYLAEFEEMFINKKFGRTSPNNIKHRTIHVSSDKTVTTLFSPEDDVIGAILKEIGKAKKSIKFMGFSFTHDGLANAIIDKAKKNVQITGIFEYLGSNAPASAYGKLITEGDKNIKIYVKKPLQSQALMHHKVFIIDDKITITGSFNFSKNASLDNDENILIINSSTVAHDYSDEFIKVKNRSYGEN